MLASRVEAGSSKFVLFCPNLSVASDCIRPAYIISSQHRCCSNGQFLETIAVSISFMLVTISVLLLFMNVTR